MRMERFSGTCSARFMTFGHVYAKACLLNLGLTIHMMPVHIGYVTNHYIIIIMMSSGGGYLPTAIQGYLSSIHREACKKMYQVKNNGSLKLNSNSD